MAWGIRHDYPLYFANAAERDMFVAALNQLHCATAPVVADPCPAPTLDEAALRGRGPC